MEAESTTVNLQGSAATPDFLGEAPAAPAPAKPAAQRTQGPAKAPAAPVETENPYDFSDQFQDDDGGFLEPPAPAAVQPAAPAAAPAGTAPVAGAAASKPAHPAWLIRQAEFHGLGADEIAESTTEQLRRDVHLLDRQAAVLSREYARQPAPTTPAPAAPVTPAADPIDAIDLGMSKEKLDEFHPDLVRLLKQFRYEDQKKTAALEAELGQYRESHQMTQREAARAALNSLFDSTPEHLALVGKEVKGQGLTTAQVEIRKQVVGAMIALEKTFRELNLPIDQQRSYEMAVRGILGGTPAAPAAQATPAAPGARPSKAEWDASQVAIPTHRRGPREPKGEERAVAAAHAKMKEDGMLDDGDDSILNGFTE